MTREQAIKHLEVIKGDCALVGDIHALDMAISALSENKTPSGEYIRKADMERILYSTNNAVRIGEEFLELPTYSIPGTAKPGEYIKKADAIRIASITTLSVDQVVSTIKALSTYSFPDSAENKSEWIPVEVALPAEGKSVLVCFKSQGGMAQDVSERFYINGEWRWSALCGIKPLAWQPLPEPYKRESEE